MVKCLGRMVAGKWMKCVPIFPRHFDCRVAYARKVVSERDEISWIVGLTEADKGVAPLRLIRLGV